VIIATFFMMDLFGTKIFLKGKPFIKLFGVAIVKLFFFFFYLLCFKSFKIHKNGKYLYTTNPLKYSTLQRTGAF